MLDSERPSADRPGPGRPSGAVGDAERREVRAWSVYTASFAAFTVPISAVLIGPWLLALATDGRADSDTLFGIGPLHLHAAAYPSFVIALAAVAQLLMLPALGARIDASARQRRWLSAACAWGAVLCGLLAVGNEWLYAGIVFLVMSVVAGVSDIVFNGLLTVITSPERRDAVSSRGVALHYAGGGVLLAVDLVLLQLHGTFGVSQGTMVRICFVVAGVWWAAVGLPAIGRLRARITQAEVGDARIGVLRRLRTGFGLLRSMPNARRYLIAFLFFSDAASAVISLSSTYLTHELFGDDATKASPFLLKLILMIQFIAIAGALVFNLIARRYSAKVALTISLLIWCAVIIYAYAALHSTWQAVVMGVAIGIGLGAYVALARSLFAQMIPSGHEGTFFSLYEVSSQGTAWLAPLIFTIVVNTTGSFRQAILSLIVLFVIGIWLLVRTDVPAATAEARAMSTPRGAGRAG